MICSMLVDFEPELTLAPWRALWKEKFKGLEIQRHYDGCLDKKFSICHDPHGHSCDLSLVHHLRWLTSSALLLISYFGLFSSSSNTLVWLIQLFFEKLFVHLGKVFSVNSGPHGYFSVAEFDSCVKMHVWPSFSFQLVFNKLSV